MKNKIALAISTLLTINTSPAQTSQSQNMMNMNLGNGIERCYGIAKAHMNDCGNNTHTCSGESKIDRDPEAWIALPTGLCKKIVGGMTKPPKPTKKE